jgi:hypothetical protein
LGKSKRSDGEITREQRLIKENQALKRENGRLRKLLARVDLDKFSNVKETIEKNYREDEEQEGQNILDKLKEEWRCQIAGCEGYLEILLYNKLSNTWYYRQCTCCTNRTKSQKYDPKSVKGIVKNVPNS